MPTLVRSSFQQATLNLPWIWTPPFGPGDYIYMQEPIESAKTTIGRFIARYVSDSQPVWSVVDNLPIPWRWKPDKLPAMNMGSRFARTILQIKAVRFEVLGNMTGADAIVEGVCRHPGPPQEYRIGGISAQSPLDAFAAYWNTLANTEAERWEAMQDQLVRVIEFKVVATAATPWDLAKGATV